MLYERYRHQYSQQLLYCTVGAVATASRDIGNVNKKTNREIDIDIHIIIGMYEA